MNSALAYSMENENTSIKQQILEGLNEQQKQVVINYHGKNICLAGPGSGRIFAV